MPSLTDKDTVQKSLIGQKVYLRVMTAIDVGNMYPWLLLSEPQALSCHPRILRTFEETVEAHKAMPKSADQQSFSIVRKDDKALVGRVNFFGMNTLSRSVELGLLIDPDEQRKGYGADALRILTRYLFRYRGLNKVYAQTAGHNLATIALLEKLGFHRDATLRDHYFYDGSFHPGYIYSLLLYELDW